jgi:hypothetical protein
MEDRNKWGRKRASLSYFTLIRSEPQRNEDPSSKVIKFQIMQSPADLQPISVNRAHPLIDAVLGI